MAIGHSHGTHPDTRFVQESTAPMTAVAVVLILALVGFLVWLFAFSGMIHRSPAPVQINQSVSNNNNGGGASSVPSPASS